MTPTPWLIQLGQLTYDAANIPGATQADFEAMVSQLGHEFQYVTLVRQPQQNVTGLYQDQQANVSLLLQQATNEVVENLQVSLTAPASPVRWLTLLNEVFGVLGSASNLLTLAGPEAGAAGAGIRYATGLASFVASQVGGHTNSPTGTPLRGLENEETTAANLAGRAADDFASTLATGATGRATWRRTSRCCSTRRARRTRTRTTRTACRSPTTTSGRSGRWCSERDENIPCYEGSC